jgi:hypothetical protein
MDHVEEEDHTEDRHTAEAEAAMPHNTTEIQTLLQRRRQVRVAQ